MLKWVEEFKEHRTKSGQAAPLRVDEALSKVVPYDLLMLIKQYWEGHTIPLSADL